MRTAVVTGSTSGIGREIARRLIVDGFNVLVTGRDGARGAQVSRELGPTSIFVRVDVTSSDGPRELAEAALDRFGHIDVLVNNAGADHTDDLLATPKRDVRRLFEVNSIAPIAVLQECAQRMYRGGSIINVTSRLANVGVPTMGVYSATKGALEALTRAAAVELAPRNIRVNAVAPGMTRTPLYEAWVQEQPDPFQTETDVVRDIPLGRLASPSDVAGAVSFLASDDAAYVTGVSIAIDGGYTAR